MMDKENETGASREQDGEVIEVRLDRLAREVLVLARNTLLVHLRFLDMALSQFTLEATSRWPLATDGQHIFFTPVEVLRRYRQERQVTARDYLHMVFHCVFHHAFSLTLVDRDCWDTAADIAVEAVISDLNLPSTESARQARQKDMLDRFRNELKQLTAEKIYRFLLDGKVPRDELHSLRELFQADDHTLWYLPHGRESQANGSDDPASRSPAQDRDTTRAECMDTWKQIAERMELDLETYSRRGDSAGSMIQNLKAVTRERYDYSAFLRKFAVMGEVMKVNEDEFDQIFYTYGLRLYRNMPLIEPLEFKEQKRIREFVIAIDTSGSVAGDLVQQFLQKTYNILRQEESFFRKINIHIIQCDAEIQEDTRITCQEDFDRYLSSVRFHGFGGTDFRPVFEYVETLQARHEFQNLKGLIYFTDGYGTFPAQKPPYPTAFVFVDDEDTIPEIPPWAIRLVLHRDEI